MHRLTIVIPCQAFDERVEDTLVSVLQNRPPSSKVIVVTAGKYNDPYDLAGEVDFIDEDPRASLVRLANRGLRESRSEVVHLLQPGCRVLEGWTSRALGHFDDRQVGAVSPAMVRHPEDHRALWLGVAFWSCGVRRVAGRGARLNGYGPKTGHVMGPSFAAGFYRRDVVVALGCFDDDMEPQCADIEMALALREMGRRVVVEPTCRVIADAALVHPKASFRTARQLERIYRRYAPVGSLMKIVHGLTSSWDVVGSFPRPRMLTRLFGRLAARCETGIRERQEQRIRDAEAELACAVELPRPVAIRVDFTERREKSKKQTAVYDRRRRAA